MGHRLSLDLQLRQVGEGGREGGGRGDSPTGTLMTMIMWLYTVVLRQIQSQYLESSGGEGGGGGSKSVEERMLAFQRECEDRARREVALGREGGGTPTAFQVETAARSRRLMMQL